MRKSDFCLCENKGADQLRSNCEADQRFCFRYTDSTLSRLLKFQVSSLLLYVTTDRFVSDLVGNPEDRFSRVVAQMLLFKCEDVGLFNGTLISSPAAARSLHRELSQSGALGFK